MSTITIWPPKLACLTRGHRYKPRWYEFKDMTGFCIRCGYDPISNFIYPTFDPEIIKKLEEVIEELNGLPL